MLHQPEMMDENNAVARLGALIAERGFGPGDRLPPERELVKMLDMSRTELRRALDVLERSGTIWRHVGKGTFLAASGGGMAGGASGSMVADLGRQMTPVRMMRARLCIEPAIAREAAFNASADAVRRILLARDRARSASNWKEYEAQDDVFHRAIAEAADNILLLALFDQVNGVRRSVLVGNVTRATARPPEGHSSFAEHDRIAEAIAERDAEGAHDAMRRHLGSVSARLFGEA